MTRNKKLLLGAAVAALAVMGGLAATGYATAGGWRDCGGWQKAGYGYHMKGGHHGKYGRMGMGAERMFDQVDANKDGKVTQAEIEKFRADRMAKHDANGDGKLQLEEFQGMWLEHARPRMVDKFQFMDEDGDGTVTDDEFKAPMSMMSRYLDRNDDGVITRGEIKPRWKGFGRRWYDRDDDDDDDDDYRKK